MSFRYSTLKSNKLSCPLSASPELSLPQPISMLLAMSFQGLHICTETVYITPQLDHM